MVNYNAMPYYANNMYNPYPNYFTNAMQQNYGNVVPQQTTPSQQPRETITTQPPIMQPTSGGKVIPVLNKDEATAAPVDLVYGTPSFFHNKGQNEIYLKQFDVPTGTAIFKTYVEKPIEEIIEKQTNNYDKRLDYISEGVDNLHRMLIEMQQEKYQQQQPIIIEPEEIQIEKTKGKRNA